MEKAKAANFLESGTDVSEVSKQYEQFAREMKSKLKGFSNIRHLRTAKCRNTFYQNVMNGSIGQGKYKKVAHLAAAATLRLGNESHVQIKYFPPNKREAAFL